jgi:transposase
VGRKKAVHAACWSHSRRKFYEAHQVCPGESPAQGIVLLIDDLCAIDAEARVQNLDLAARDRLRQQQARPLLERIRQKIEASREKALLASKLGGAVAYTLGLWERLHAVPGLSGTGA